MSAPPVTQFDRVVRTVCSPNCLGTCGVNAFVKDDVIVKMEPASFPEPGYERICLKGIAMATQRLHHKDRLTHPLIRTGARGADGWERVSWAAAYDYIAEKLTKIAAEHGWRSASWHSLSGNYGIRSLSSGRRVTNCLGATQFTPGGLSSDAAGTTAYIAALGTVGANEISDVGHARYFLNVGRNAADTAHSEMHFIFDAMENGCKVVVVDPRFSRTAAKADQWVAPRPGTDSAFALGLIHVVVTEGLLKRDYVLAHTNLPFLVRRDTRALLRERECVSGGSEAYMVWDESVGRAVPVGSTAVPRLSGSCDLEGVEGGVIECHSAFDASWDVWKDYTPEHAASICDVPADEIRKVARDYATTDPAWIWMGQGPQRYASGHLAFRAFITLAALCGNIGKPFAGISLFDGPIVHMAAPQSWLSPGGKKGHSLPGTKLVDIIASGEPYPIKSLWISASGFGTQTPFFKRFLHEALPKLELFAVSEQIMTEAARYADIVLPCVSYFEDDWDLVPGGENWFMQLRRRAVPPVGVSRNDFDIFRGLFERLGQGEDWQIDAQEDCRRIMAEAADPRFNQISWDQLVRDGAAHAVMERPYVPFKDMKFNTPSGRIELYQEQLADLGEAVLLHKEPIEGQRSAKAAQYPLHLITYKHVHTTHAIHTMLPYILEVLPGPKVEISPVDAQSRGIEDRSEVLVFNDRGKFRVTASVSNSVPPGTLAMAQGWWRKHFAEGHPQDLTQIPHNDVQARVGGESNWALWDLLCDVRKVETA